MSEIDDVIHVYDAAHPYWRQEKREREIKAAEEAEQRTQRAREARRQVEQQQTALSNSKAWCEWVDQRIGEHFELYSEHLMKELGEVIAKEREDRDREINAAIAEAKRAIDVKLEALEQRLNAVRQAEQLANNQRWAAIDQRISRLEKELDGRLGPSALHESKCVVESKLESKLETLEQRLKAAAQAEQQANNQQWTAIDQRIRHLEQEIDGRFGPDALHESKCAVESKLESKLEALEQRLKAVPGKLPVAKTWRPESVTYQAEFVVHDGALWQAKKDTAQPPGGADWICVARAGRDAVTPNVRGTYDVHETYKALDIVVLDGASFIARKDNPGVCPVSGDWQLASKQGRPGRKGRARIAGAGGTEGRQRRTNHADAR